MKSVTWLYFTLLALGCCCAAPSRADSSISMDANTPEVRIELRRVARNFLRLPTLQYAFTFDTVCVENLQPVSLQLSVADTRKTLRGDEIGVNTATSISLKIPAKQIAPVAIQGFCEEPEVSEGEARPHLAQSKITIPAALSAQASLRCASEVDEHIVYVSRPLDVTLACEPSEESIAPP